MALKKYLDVYLTKHVLKTKTDEGHQRKFK